MASVAEYLSQLQTLTQRNLEILKAINDSFFTKKEHLSVNIGGNDYAIPSFLCLENKINALQDNFDNLVYAPKTGEATFNIDGNSRKIELKGYTCTPDRVTIDTSNILGFKVEQNDIFKDLLTPNPYIHFDLQSIPNDITKVNVRKVAMKSDTLRDIMNTLTAKSQGGGRGIMPMEWSALYKILSIYKEDEDYVMYDTLRDMPIRKNLGYGVYTVKSIIKDDIDTNLDEFLELEVHEALKYTLYDETIEKYLKIGDNLITYDDNTKLEIVDINIAKNILKLKILNGDHLNIIPDPEGGVSGDSSKLKFFYPVDYGKDKYINVPLEEDRYICIFIAPVNGSVNTQAPWGGGVLIDTDVLCLDENGSTSNKTFKDYYEENVRNIGDLLYEMTSTMTSSIMKYTEEDFNKFTKYIPIINVNNLKVLQINTHLNNSETVKTIRTLYSQKQDLNRQLVEIQSNITDINKTLSEISFADTTGMRAIYESQLDQYNARRNDIVASMGKLTEEINITANESTIPIENAKYRIRGFYDWHITDSNVDAVLAEFWKHVHGIKVQYRYKNHNADTGTAVSIGSFIFSDWNEMPSPILQPIPTYKDGYKFGYPQYQNDKEGVLNTSHDNSRLNEPSFNQIDIPISQGESVDIRLKIVWDFGFPFIETTSDWSSIVNIPFPEEYTKDVQVLDIVNENTKDIESNKFTKILDDLGVVSHVDDRITDQDVTYLHKPESISSGFYTTERRIIPLRDKLLSMDNILNRLNDLVSGSSGTDVACTAIIDNSEYSLTQMKTNKLILPAYDVTRSVENSCADAIITIQIKNISEHNIELYSLFPGANDVIINNIVHSKFDKEDYTMNDMDGLHLSRTGGVKLCYPKNENDKVVTTFADQHAGQWVTFRVNNPYDGRKYYGWNTDPDNDVNDANLDNTFISKFREEGAYNDGLIVYPYLNDNHQLQIPGTNIHNSYSLLPGGVLSIPIMCHYRLGNTNTLHKYISFDIRTSLYSDPINYTIDINASFTESIQDKVLRAEKDRQLSRFDSISNNSKYISTIK